MGIFSTKKKVYVDSVVYNLAGDTDSRPNLIRSTILGTILSGSKKSIGENLLAVAMNNQGAKQRRFFEWAKTNYSLGMPTATLQIFQPVAAAVAGAGLSPLLGLAANQKVKVLSSIIDEADIHYWADAWMAEFHPGVTEDGWGAEWLVAPAKIAVFINDVEVTRLNLPADLVWGVGAKNRQLLYVTYRIETQNPVTGMVTLGPAKMFTYRMGTGNVTFDSLQGSYVQEAEFFPVIPLRIDKKSIRDPSFESVYPMVKKSYKKLMGAKIDEILDSIEDNENLDDIYCAYLVSGVSMNTDNQAGREYIYKFMANLLEVANPYGDIIRLVPTLAEIREYVQSSAWTRSHVAGDTYSPWYGTTRPVSYAQYAYFPKKLSLHLNAGTYLQADTRIKWYTLTETDRVGNCLQYDGQSFRGTAKKGEFHIILGADVKVPSVNSVNQSDENLEVKMNEYNRVYMMHQYSKYRYRMIECVGLEFENYIYQGHAAIQSAKGALLNPDESPFIVPLHMPTLVQMGRIKAAELANTSSYLVFTSYQIVKIRWYQRGIFKIILMVGAIFLSIFTAGASLGAAVGFLGANAAVGAFLGASVASAAVVGAIANAVAAIIVSSLITKASVAIFGEKFGAIIGAIASFAASAYATQFISTGNLNVDWGQILRADKLLELTQVVGKSYTDWVNADLGEMQKEAAALQEQYSEQLKKVETLSEEILGMTNGEINPMMFTEAREYVGESSESFLSRTLLTGSELAELSRAMVDSFTELSLELPRASFTPYA